MAHNVICLYCGEKFDRDTFPFHQIGRRYAHEGCYNQHKEELEKEEKDRLELEEYIKKLFGDDFLGPKVYKQIKEYKEQYNYTYSGMRRALTYAFEVKKEFYNIKKARNGIGIVPYVYKDAYNYYYAIWLAQQKNDDKVLQDYIPKTVEIHIPVPERKIRKRNLFSFLDEEGENE